jgi:hypothetical protein
MSLRNNACATRAELPEFAAYADAMLAYKAAKKKYAQFRKHCGCFEFSSNPAERLRFFDEKQEHSRACKVFYAAKAKYSTAAACLEMGQRKLAVPAAVFVPQNIPLEFEDIRLEERAAEAQKTMTPEQFEAIKEAALAREKRTQSMEERNAEK